MRIILLALFCLTLAPALRPAPAGAQTATVRVTEPFARAAAAGRTGAAYMNIQGGPDRLISVTSDVSGRAELHETVMENGVMSMHPVGGVLINPGAATRLAPGGLHIMLMDLNRTLKDGDRITLTLTFERAGKIAVIAPVARAGAPAAPHAAMPGNAMPGLGGQMRH